jgi:DNA-binding Lrp family transcriptional regulator
MGEVQLSEIERRVLAVVQRGFPQTATPYRDMAEEVGIETAQLLSILQNWQKRGIIRRVGAVVNHFKVGLPAAAMVVWRVDAENIERVGNTLAAFSEVSHAYERTTTQSWPYNLYTMVHAPDEKRIEEIVREMSRSCGVSDYLVIKTIKELKKTPPAYIDQ